MKRIILTAALLLGALGLKAQDCDAIMLPYFHNDKAQVDNYKAVAPEKYKLRCLFGRSAFYETDVAPENAVMMSIGDVVDPVTSKPLPKNFKVNLGVMGFYHYNFRALRAAHADRQICFSTPGSTHRYLVMRTHEEMQEEIAEFEKSMTK